MPFYSRQENYNNCPSCGKNGKLIGRTQTESEENIAVDKTFICQWCGKKYTAHYELHYEYTKHDKENQ